MFVQRLVTQCDMSGRVYSEPTEGAAIVTQGATGRWCEVLWVGPEHVNEVCANVKTYDEAVAYASMRGGEIDF